MSRTFEKREVSSAKILHIDGSINIAHKVFGALLESSSWWSFYVDSIF